MRSAALGLDPVEAQRNRRHAREFAPNQTLARSREPPAVA